MLKKRILVSDVDADILNLTKIILGNKYEVLLATSDVEAVEKAKEELPDLILLDAEMHSERTLGTCKILKNQAKTKHIPIVIFSVLAREVNSKMIDEAGVDGYLQKPFAVDELLTEVEKHLNRD